MLSVGAGLSITRPDLRFLDLTSDWARLRVRGVIVVRLALAGRSPLSVGPDLNYAYLDSMADLTSVYCLGWTTLRFLD